MYFFYSYLERIQTRGNGPNLCIPIGYQNIMGKYHGFSTIWSILNLSGHLGPRDFLEIFMKFRKIANFLGMQLSCGQSQVADHFFRILYPVIWPHSTRVDLFKILIDLYESFFRRVWNNHEITCELSWEFSTLWPSEKQLLDIFMLNKA